MMKKFTWRTGLCAVASVLLLLAMLYTCIASFTFDKSEYPANPPYGEMADALIQYLRGGMPALGAPFTDQESQHMVDVLALFDMGRTIARVGFVGALFVFALCIWQRDMRSLRRGMWMGLAAFFGGLLLLAIWAMIDFSGWFEAMHRVAFDNELWLLDPRESLLIQMLPLSFFIRAVMRIVLRFLLSCGIWVSLLVVTGNRQNS